MAREHCETVKIATQFGDMFVHLENDDAGVLTGAHISHAKKVPDDQISQFIETLSNGLHRAVKGHPLRK